MCLKDLDMFDEVSDTPTVARTSNLNEELGQVSHCQGYIKLIGTGSAQSVPQFRCITITYAYSFICVR